MHPLSLAIIVASVSVVSAFRRSLVLPPRPGFSSLTSHGSRVRVLRASHGSQDDKFDKLLNLFGDFSENMNRLSLSVDNLSKTVQEHGVRIDQLSARVDQQGARINQIQAETSKVGDVFELLARHELVKKYGEDYGSGFEVVDLHGLARLAFPKDKRLKEGKLVKIPSSAKQSKELTRRVSCLAREAKRSVDALLDIDEDSLCKGKNNKLMSGLKRYRKLTSDDEKLDFLGEDPLGLWAFSLSLYDQPSSEGKELPEQHFDSRYEFDVRGSTRVQVNKKAVTVEYRCGEIKCGKDFTKSVGQLLKRLSILAKAGEVLLGKDTGSKPLRFILKGEIFSLTNWQDQIDELVIQNELNRWHLKSPKGEVFLDFEPL